jgi:polyhydroxybutyrate depolymerase
MGRRDVKPLQKQSLIIAMFLFGLSLATAGQSIPPDRLGPGDHSLSLMVGGLERQYLVHVPLRSDGKSPMPVVIMLHGGGGTAETARTSTGWVVKADEAGFIVAFPEATRLNPSQPASFLSNPPIWNDGSGRGHAGRGNVDDTGFIGSMIEDLIARFPVDERRIYVTGFSNGASMAFRAGVELSGPIAAIAPVSGIFWLRDSKPERPVPMLYIIGTQDPFNPLEGGDVKTPWGRREKKPPIRESILAWAKMLDCSLEPKVVYDRDGVKALSYGPGKGGAGVLFYTIEGMGHAWPGGKQVLSEKIAGKGSDKVKAVDVIWDFFKGSSR